MLSPSGLLEASAAMSSQAVLALGFGDVEGTSEHG